MCVLELSSAVRPPTFAVACVLSVSMERMYHVHS